MKDRKLPGWRNQSSPVREFKISKRENALPGPAIKLSIKISVCGPENIFQGPEVKLCRPETAKIQAILQFKRVFFAV
jgi:hypothetical protein